MFFLFLPFSTSVKSDCNQRRSYRLYDDEGKTSILLRMQILIDRSYIVSLGCVCVCVCVWVCIHVYSHLRIMFLEVTSVCTIVPRVPPSTSSIFSFPRLFKKLFSLLEKNAFCTVNFFNVLHDLNWIFREFHCDAYGVDRNKVLFGINIKNCSDSKCH